MNIQYYIIKRILYTIPIIIGVSSIIFIIFNVAAIDPTIAHLGRLATQEQIASLKHELGLDKPLYLQYFDTLKSSFNFKFGKSWFSNQNILEMVKPATLVSLSLALPALIISNLISIFFSFISILHRKKWINKTITIVCIMLMSISGLIYILFFQWLFAFKLGWFPIEGYEYGFPNFIPYIVLPALIWITINVGPDILFYRTIFLEEYSKSYIRTAKAMGKSEKFILFKYVLKNALIPIITNIVNQIPYVILGAVLTESFFGIPGLGSIILNAINYSDFPVIKALTVLSALFYIIFNSITDVLYMIIDPRIKLKY